MMACSRDLNDGTVSFTASASFARRLPAIRCLLAPASPTPAVCTPQKAIAFKRLRGNAAQIDQNTEEMLSHSAPSAQQARRHCNPYMGTF